MISRDIGGGFVAEVGSCDRASWYRLTAGFRDANLYQAWSYEGVRARAGGVEHLIVRRGERVVAAAQVRVVRVPGTRAGIAYVRWGPLWRAAEAANGADDVEVFRVAIRELRREFSRDRGLVLRLYPLAHRGRDEAVARVLGEEGFVYCERGKRDRTLVVDLAAALEALRASLDQKWRNGLNRAERNGLELTCGEDDGLFEAVERMHAQMSARKGLARATDIGHLRAVQRDLPEGQKLRVVVCHRGGEPCAGAIFAAIGDAGLYVRGATSDAGLATNGAYLVQWAFVRWLREHGFASYDLNGANPEASPGTYHFKRGLAGRRGREVEFLGTFQVADRALSEWVVRGGERLVNGYRQAMAAARSARRAHAGRA